MKIIHKILSYTRTLTLWFELSNRWSNKAIDEAKQNNIANFSQEILRYACMICHLVSQIIWFNSSLTWTYPIHTHTHSYVLQIRKLHGYKYGFTWRGSKDQYTWAVSCVMNEELGSFFLPSYLLSLGRSTVGEISCHTSRWKMQPSLWYKWKETRYSHPFFLVRNQILIMSM